MSWKALDWATDIRVGSPTMRPILILLANKADEKFSCYPKVGTLVTESCAARSTVLETLKRLEVEGFITRVAQYHESGAQRSSRYLLIHPDVPHLKPGPDSGPPGPQVGRGGSDPWTGGVQDLDPLNPPEEPPSEPSLTILLQSMPEPWRLSGEEAMKLSPAVEYALASGWTSQTLKAHLSRRPDGVRYPAAVLARRLAVLPTPPSPSLRRKTPWCGECEDEQSRTITVTLPDGTEAAALRLRCSPQKRPQPVDQKIANIEER